MNPLPNVPWGTTGTFMLGLIGVIGVAVLVVQLVLGLKKLLGRTPPFHEELDKRDKAIRRQVFAVENNLKAAHAENTKRIEALEERYDEMQKDRERKWSELKEDINGVGQTLAYIRGKIDEQERTP